MKLTILGNNGPYPAPGGACSGYLLSGGNTHVLIDCGTGCLANLPKHLPFAALDGVILSHLHYDHMSDMLPMQYALQFNPRSEPLPVHAPAAPTSVRALLDAPSYALREMEDVQIGDIRFRFFPGRHPVQSFALRAECEGRVFGYTGDTNVVDGMAAFMQGANLLLADAGLSTGHWHMEAPHLSAKACGELAAQAQCEKLLLTHLNPRYNPSDLEQEASETFPGAEFSRIGASYEV